VTLHGRRVAVFCAAIGTAFIGIAAVPSAAAAAPHHAIRVSLTAYTDSATPDETTFYPSTNDLPVGTTVDDEGVTHTRRAYLSFEIGGINRARLSAAQLRGYERTVDDCTVARDLAVRPVVGVEAENSWANPPAYAGAAVPLLGTDGDCESGLQGDLTTALSRALTRGQGYLFVEIRVPARHETDARWARRVADEFTLDVTLVNRPPRKPTELAVWNSDTPCSDDFTVNQSFSAFANMSDQDTNPGDSLTPEFEFWNTAAPATTTAMSTGIQSGGSGLYGVGDIPTRTLPDGRYGWHARVFDERAYSPWSDPCYFTVDRTAPATAPTVSSPDYPENSPVPTGKVDTNGTFLFTAAGVADVAAFEYGPDRFSTRRVSADEVGGTATVRWAPSGSGAQTLLVRSVDRAGNVSPDRVYRMNVRDLRVSDSTVSREPDPSGALALVVRLRLTTQTGNGIASYAYRIEDGPEQTVAAEPGGATDVTLPPLTPGRYAMTYTGRDAAGKDITSAIQTWFNAADDPTVTSDGVYPINGPEGGAVGVPGTFTVTPRIPGHATEIRWSVGGTESGSAPIGPDGRATFTWTPSRAGSQYLSVSAIYAGDQSSWSTSVRLTVAD
jgi:hypothetical protein